MPFFRAPAFAQPVSLVMIFLEYFSSFWVGNGIYFHDDNDITAFCLLLILSLAHWLPCEWLLRKLATSTIVQCNSALSTNSELSTESPSRGMFSHQWTKPACRNRAYHPASLSTCTEPLKDMMNGYKLWIKLIQYVVASRTGFNAVSGSRATFCGAFCAAVSRVRRPPLRAMTVEWSIISSWSQ